MSRLFVVIVFAACLASPTVAQEPSPEAQAAARELSAIMTRDTMNEITAAMAAQVWPSIERAFGGKVNAATLADLRGEFEKSVAAFTADVMAEAPAIYARHFTAQELRDIVAFYKSPAGTKALQEMPKVLADVGTAIAPRMQAFQGELNTRVRAILEKHGYKE
jgi:hypothetical protein